MGSATNGLHYEKSTYASNVFPVWRDLVSEGADVPRTVRDATWDIARGIGMMLVIYGHLLEPLYPARPDLGHGFVASAFRQWQFIYSFHMMLFFFVSGAVNRNLAQKPWQDVLRSSLRLLALAWIVHFLGVIASMALGTAPEATGSLRGAITAFLFPVVEGYYWSIGVLWFLTSLCFVQLLAFLALRRLRATAVVILAVAGTAVVVYLDAPNQFLFRTWLPGLSFFVLGMAMARRGVRSIWAWSLPSLLGALFLAPLNDGCAFTLHESCARFASGPFGVRMFAGSYGFLPLFFLTALAGTLGIVAASAGLSKTAASPFFAFVGRHSLELFIINGFVATFLPGRIAGIPWPPFTPLLYAGLAAGVIGAHLVALLLLRRFLGWLNDAALATARWLTAAASRVVGAE